MDDALQSLKAVIYRKHMILTVRNPGQLRTNTNTHGGRRKATGFRGLHLLLEPEELERL